MFLKNNPTNWRRLSIDSTKRVRKLFCKENVDAFLFTNKIVLRFHETINVVLAPKGVKRVGIVLSVN